MKKNSNCNINRSEQQDNITPEGVFCAKKKDGTIYYRSSLTYRGKHISLGSYSTSAQAHEAYKVGRLILSSDIDISGYTQDSPLDFEKWVVLLNFKNNGIYIGTPVYLGQRLFYYYLTPDIILKFDMDDLFYYSSHKIMQRGGHLFVADYGSQITLLTRYGAKPYAVEGADYSFMNGDKYDYRRQNLKISNRYHGVIAGQKGKFRARIHLNGYFNIGEYSTALEAAIAYNKAIDIVKKLGCNKGFLPNYIDEIPPRQYADIYFKTEISEKIKNWAP